MSTVQTVVATGTGLSPAVVQQIHAAESQQPEGTPMEWIWTCGTVTLPAVNVGPVHVKAHQVVSAQQIATGYAALLNALARAGHGLTGIKTWGGHPLAEAKGGQIIIRWVKEKAWSASLVAALAGVGTAAVGILVASGVGDVIAALVTAVLVAVGVYVAIHGWRLVAWVNRHVIQPLAQSPIGPVAVVAALGLGAYLLYRAL